MIEKEKAKAAVEALMSERRASQKASSNYKLSPEYHKVLQRRAVVLGLVGTTCGALAGYFIFDQWVLASCVGLAMGVATATTWSAVTLNNARQQMRHPA